MRFDAPVGGWEKKKKVVNNSVQRMLQPLFQATDRFMTILNLRAPSICLHFLLLELRINSEMFYVHRPG